MLFHSRSGHLVHLSTVCILWPYIEHSSLFNVVIKCCKQFLAILDALSYRNCMACMPSHMWCQIWSIAYELAAFVSVLIMLLFIVSHLCRGNVKHFDCENCWIFYSYACCCQSLLFDLVLKGDSNKADEE